MSFEWLWWAHFVGTGALVFGCYRLGLRDGRRRRYRFRRVWPMAR